MKVRLEKLLKKHGYSQDERPDHREWMKWFDEFSVHVWLDRNKPDNFNGFQLRLEAYLRNNIEEKQIQRLLDYFENWHETETT